MIMAKVKSVLIFSLLALLAGLFTTSCSGPENAKEVASLDSVRTRLDSAETLLMSIDSAKITATIAQVQKDMAYVQEALSKMPADSVMERETATFLTDYRSVLKPYKLFIRERAKLAQDIDYSQQQITHLMHDLEKGIVEESDVPKYVDTEKAEAENVIHNTRMIAGTIRELEPRYNTAEPQVRMYIEELKQKEKQAEAETKKPAQAPVKKSVPKKKERRLFNRK